MSDLKPSTFDLLVSYVDLRELLIKLKVITAEQATAATRRIHTLEIRHRVHELRQQAWEEDNGKESIKTK